MVSEAELLLWLVGGVGFPSRGLAGVPGSGVGDEARPLFITSFPSAGISRLPPGPPRLAVQCLSCRKVSAKGTRTVSDSRQNSFAKTRVPGTGCVPRRPALVAYALRSPLGRCWLYSFPAFSAQG